MSHPPELYPGSAQIANPFPGLSQPVVMGWALWSLGMIVGRACRLTAIADGWSCQRGQPFPCGRERGRDTDREAGAKAGPPRPPLDLSRCWTPGLNWVLEGGSGTPRAVARDATRWGPCFVRWVIRGVDRGCAVPILWRVLKAEVTPPWKPEWRAVLRRCGGQCRRPGPGSCSPTGGCTPNGYLKRWFRSAGPRCGASTLGGPSGPREGPPGGRLPLGCPREEAGGKGGARRWAVAKPAGTVPCGPIGAKAIRTPGGSGPLGHRTPPRPGGRA